MSFCLSLYRQVELFRQQPRNEILPKNSGPEHEGEPGGASGLHKLLLHQRTPQSEPAPEGRRKEATFTLTNIVPQRNESNSGTWSQLEKEVLQRFNSFCNGTMHVITGTMPYVTERWLRERVSIPEYMWSAYCCPSFSDSISASERLFFPAYAAVGRNDPNSTEDIVRVDSQAKTSLRGYDVKKMPVEELEGIRKGRLGVTEIKQFDQQCRLK